MQSFFVTELWPRINNINYILAGFYITTLIGRDKMKQSLFKVNQCYENTIVFCGYTTFLKMDKCNDGLPMFSGDTTFERMHHCTSIIGSKGRLC